MDQSIFTNITDASSSLPDLPQCYQSLLNIFGTCYEVGNAKHIASLVFSFISILCWIIAGFPQIFQSIKAKKADDISTGFLVIWTVGDSLSLLGSLLSEGVLMFQSIMSSLYVVLSMLLMIVCIHFKRVSGGNAHVKFICIFYPVYFCFLLALGLSGHYKPSINNILGLIISWGSGIIYISSRVVQITQTCKSKQVESINPYLFVLAVCANVSYVLQICLYGGDASYWQAQAPFLAGSGGILPFDFFTAIYVNYLLRKQRNRLSKA